MNSAIASQKKRACAYVYVHESVAAEFVSESKKALIELFGTDPKSNSDYSRIINAKTVTRLASLIDPAKVIAGGKSDPEAYYLDPTLLYPIAWDDKIMEDEIFGPILPILTHKTLDEAFGRIAATQLPLSISNDYLSNFHVALEQESALVTATINDNISGNDKTFCVFDCQQICQQRSFKGVVPE